jgi:uncharacterized DUF497 family protein
MQIDYIVCPDAIEEKLTNSGRYLSVFFVFKPDDNTAVIISARDMSKKERKSYARK